MGRNETGGGVGVITKLIFGWRGGGVGRGHFNYESRNDSISSVLHVHSKFVESIVFCDLLMYSIVWFFIMQLFYRFKNTETGKK